MWRYSLFPSAATNSKHFLCSRSVSSPRCLLATNWPSADLCLSKTCAPSRFSCCATAIASAIPLSRLATARAFTRKLFLRVASSAASSVWWEPAWASQSCRKWPSTRTRAAVSCASTILQPRARSEPLFCAGGLYHARITRFSRSCAPHPLHVVRKAHFVRFPGDAHFFCWAEILIIPELGHGGLGTVRCASALFHGNRHIVKIQRYSRLVKQFQPHGGVEEAVRLMDVRGREVNERRRAAQSQTTKAFLLRRSFFHFHSAVREREIPGFRGLRRPGKLQFFNRCRINQQRPAIHRVDLRRHFLSINFKSIGDHNSWSFFPEFNQRDSVARSRAVNRRRQHFRDSHFATHEINLQNAVLESSVSQRPIHVRHLVLRDHVGGAHRQRLDVCERNVSDGYRADRRPIHSRRRAPRQRLRWLQAGRLCIGHIQNGTY